MTRRKVLDQHLTIVIYPAPDLPGQWISHCLQLDLISQGNDPQQALEMIAESIQICAEDNIAEGRPPLDYRSAPKEVWDMARLGDHLVERIVRLPAPAATDITLAPITLAS